MSALELSQMERIRGLGNTRKIQRKRKVERRRMRMRKMKRIMP